MDVKLMEDVSWSTMKEVALARSGSPGDLAVVKETKEEIGILSD